MLVRLPIAAFVAVLALATSALADETTPAQYVANIRQHVAFLDQASKLAAERTSSDKLRAFAKVQAEGQEVAAKDLHSWEASQPTGGLNSPVDVAAADGAGISTTSDTLMTGRSVAVDDREEAGVLMASPGVIVLPQLANANGKSFDDLFVATQTSSLKELQGLYEAYGMTGNDPALRALALRELPLVKQRLAELEAL